MQKQCIFKTKGMQRDLSEYAFNSEYAFENMNMRVFPTDSNTLLSLVNERGNKKLEIYGIEGSTNLFEGIPIGKSVIDNKIILFTTSNSEINDIILSPESYDNFDILYNEETLSYSLGDIINDRIYKFWIENNVMKGKILFSGNLNFDSKHPIETLNYSENKEIQKVYWVDGINYPRVINIEEDNPTWNNDSFNFRNTLKLQEKVSVEKIYGRGLFSAGTIQYAFTYFNSYGQETNIFNITSLYYISSYNIANDADDIVSNSFRICINNIDNKFKYLRIYSVFRSSPDVITLVKKVVDIKLEENVSIDYIDTNIGGEVIENTKLLYVGGEDLIFGTISQKDNTLFAGNISIKRPIIPKNIKDLCRGLNVQFTVNPGELPSEDDKIFTIENTSNIQVSPSNYIYSSQLNRSSNEIKGFKYLETYRFGIQFQYNTGQWSDPIYIKDLKNNFPIDGNYVSNYGYVLPYAYCNLTDNAIIEYAKALGYIAVRPVVVFPTIFERECICQGVVCPTVFNKKDRKTGECMSQSSWFSRPNAPFHLDQSDAPLRIDRDGGSNIYNSREVLVDNDTYHSYIEKGAFATFEHYYSVGSTDLRNGEIQCNQDKIAVINPSSKDTDYFVDQSIVTLHSPDIEFDESIESITENLKFRIIGIVPITSSSSSLDITTSIPPISSQNGFKKHDIVNNNISRFGFRGTVNGIFWDDDPFGGTLNTTLSIGYVIYPFHKTGAINNLAKTELVPGSEEIKKSSVLKSKNLVNLKYSFNSCYFKQPTNPNFTTIWEGNGASDIKVFNALNSSILKLKKPINSGYLTDITYRGNVDTLITPNDAYIIYAGSNSADNFSSAYGTLYPSQGAKWLQYRFALEPIKMKYNSSSHAVIALNYSDVGEQYILPCLNDIYTFDDENHPDAVHAGIQGSLGNKTLFWEDTQITKSIKQDSLDVFFAENFNRIPSNYGGDVKVINNIRGENVAGSGPEYGYLWLGELYRDPSPNPFGGTDENAIEQNAWLVAGKTVSLLDEYGNTKNIIPIRWTEGDTYYQRYDHLKTYSPTFEEENGITEIISFMCETRINLDGRYDTRRGVYTEYTLNNTNFNRLNKAYTQDNNYFIYRGINSDKINLNNFKNTVLWSLSKVSGELIDSWTNVSFANSMDLDGELGPVNSIQRFNNQLIAFQDYGISQILYNENAQIATTQGVPIELANSGKVSGKRCITNLIGCKNKWTICNTLSGLCFIDNYSKSLYLFNGELKNISNSLGFHSWFSNNIKDEIWDPLFEGGITTLYDNVNKDVYIVSEDKCLGFSENIGQFSSFFSYEKVSYLCNIKDKSIMVKCYREGNKHYFSLWEQHAGEYNNFFGEYKPFYTSVIANQDPTKDKIFNTVEFRSDTYNSVNGDWKLSNDTFDTLVVENEYQRTSTSLSMIKNRPSNLQKQFRIWRANIGRNELLDNRGKGKRDRIRNPWAKVTLLKSNLGDNPNQKTLLQDIVVHYFD